MQAPIHSKHRAAWIIMVMVLAAGGIWLMAKWLHPPHSTSDQSSGLSHSPQDHSMPAPPEPETGPAQAYAMVSPVKQQLIGVKTTVVERRALETTVRAVARVTYDEQRIAQVNLRVSGWVEELFVDFTGQLVQKGQPLLTLYSPDLVATQEEYLLALRARDEVRDSPLKEVRGQADELVSAARDRLHLWTLTDHQIEEVARRAKAQTYLTIAAPATGYVIEKPVFKGMFVQPDVRLYSIADLRRVWMNVEIYEFEVPFVLVGQAASATFAAYPGEKFHGRVAYIYPYVNPNARTVKVRLEVPNPKLLLKPDMYGTAEILVDRGMQLALPETAVMDSGIRKLVYVQRGEGLFEPREVILGPKVGPYYEAREGLQAGERVVTSGNFLIDSESKLMATTNMMGSLGMGGIKMEQARMGDMEMGEMPTASKPSGNGKATDQEKSAAGLRIALSTEPPSPRIGENLIRVTVKDEARKPVPISHVQLTYTMPMPGMMPATVPLKAMPSGTYEARVNLGMSGQWELTATVQRSGHPDVTAPFSVIAGGAMSGMPGM